MRPLPCHRQAHRSTRTARAVIESAGVRAEPSVTDPIGKQIGKRPEATHGYESGPAFPAGGAMLSIDARIGPRRLAINAVV
jgi:hypothetical protein